MLPFWPGSRLASIHLDILHVKAAAGEGVEKHIGWLKAAHMWTSSREKALRVVVT